MKKYMRKSVVLRSDYMSEVRRSSSMQNLNYIFLNRHLLQYIQVSSTISPYNSTYLLLLMPLLSLLLLLNY